MELVSAFCSRFLSSRMLPLSLIFIGIALRFSHYISNRSFWLDEAWLARDVLTRTFKEILLNIINRDLPAIPPIGFLIVEKLSVNTFGNHEFALRPFPFL